MRPLGLFLSLVCTERQPISSQGSWPNPSSGTRVRCSGSRWSEFKEKYLITKLIGLPPAIVGYGPPGLLTEAIRLNPEQESPSKESRRPTPMPRTCCSQLPSKAPSWITSAEMSIFGGPFSS